MRWRYVPTVLFVLAVGNAAVLLWDLVVGSIHFTVLGTLTRPILTPD
jgi:hypothetical protein